MVYQSTLFTLACIGFALYFVILAGERIQSLVRAGKNKQICMDGLHQYMAVLCCFSFVSTIILLVIFALNCISNPPGAAIGGMSNFQLIILCAAVGTFLLSGMVHTEYSIPGIQFAAYGVLIAGMVLWMIMQKDILDLGSRIVTISYIVAFSMSIPVVYPSKIEKKNLFHMIESIVSFVLVAVFAILLYGLLAGTYEWLFNPVFLILAIAGDIPVLLLRRKEEMNWFVLVALSITIVLWIVGVIMGLL